eukprot:CAMPEP_0167792800 /NCGR_PEP_ID=MMETSP0111_2-20121227/12770_1 /TAXON_ID=91324 /ORGANISM="Lotharella globosa, Strain CCCM811" /LENGTH=537 /DNA_ID=CAMNT_0007685775 /DNA_START=73 /DNA_END=1688 /DNA_ORIENTATION=-
MSEEGGQRTRVIRKVAVAGCVHGEIETIYKTIQKLEKTEKMKVDLLVCCGDFQAVRNPEDLACMVTPKKYRLMKTFYKYYSGKRKAPVLTVFVGGNHEASNVHLSLFNGGWVAPNIYYMGHANVVNFAGLRIAGISGIYNQRHYHLGFGETMPFDDSQLRSVYHIREASVLRLLQIARPVDIMLSHDWPHGIMGFGSNNKDLLDMWTQQLRRTITSNDVGNPALSKILHVMKPRYWFAAHYHVRFPAEVSHGSGSKTSFLALGKCLPDHEFLQVVDVEVKQPNAKVPKFEYDPEWLAIMHSTAGVMHYDMKKRNLGTLKPDYKPEHRPREEDIAKITEEFKSANNGGLEIPLEFARPVELKAWDGKSDFLGARQAPYRCSVQTVAFLRKLKLSNRLHDFLSNNPKPPPGQRFCEPVPPSEEDKSTNRKGRGRRATPRLSLASTRREAEAKQTRSVRSVRSARSGDAHAAHSVRTTSPAARARGVRGGGVGGASGARGDAQMHGSPRKLAAVEAATGLAGGGAPEVAPAAEDEEWQEC